MQSDQILAPFAPMEQSQQGYEAHYQYSDRMEVTQYHCHDYYELYIHLHGGEFMGVDNQLFALKPNQVFVLPPFCMHGLSCTDEMHDYERAYLNISPEVMRVLGCEQIDLNQFLRAYASRGVCTYQLSDNDAERFVSWIRQIQANQAGESDVFARFRNYALMINLLNLLCRTMRKADPVEGEAFSSGIMQEILTYINNH